MWRPVKGKKHNFSTREPGSLCLLGGSLYGGFHTETHKSQISCLPSKWATAEPEANQLLHHHSIHWFQLPPSTGKCPSQFYCQRFLLQCFDINADAVCNLWKAHVYKLPKQDPAGSGCSYRASIDQNRYAANLWPRASLGAAEGEHEASGELNLNVPC